MNTNDLPEMPAPEGRPGLEKYAPLLMLIASLGATYLLWENARGNSIADQGLEFDYRVRYISDHVHRRILYYEQVLHGVRGFYLNQREMERNEFTGYIADLELENNFPGIQGISFSMLIPDAQKSSHISAMRKAGLSGYTITPGGRRPAYAPVAFIEPMNERNERVVGFDNLASPARRAAVEQARDEDMALISEKLLLKQEGAQIPQAGVLMFLPVYKRRMQHDTLVTRRANIEGWFAASFRMGDFVAGLLDEHSRGIDVEIFDGHVLSDSFRLFGSPHDGASRFSAVVPVEVGGRLWSIAFSSRPEFESQRNVASERYTAFFGVLLSLFLSSATWLLMRSRQRAARMTAMIRYELEMRKQAEHKTQDLLLFNEAIVEKSPYGIAVFMAGGQCVMANEAYVRAIGGTLAGVLAQNFRTNPAWHKYGLLDCANRALESGMTVRRDIEGKTMFDRSVIVDCIFAPITISGKPHLLLMLNDVAARVETKRALTDSMRQLEEKELAKTRFLAAAGHDLRQPVAAAGLFIDALKLTGPTQRQGAIIQRLDQSMSTFNGLLDALLNVSKLDAGMITPEYTTINVAELFNWLEQNFAPMALEKNIRFRLYFPMREMLFVHSDIGLIKSVLMNLVSNAVKFTSKGSILVSARRRNNGVLFQVWDSGMGIPEDQVKRIFDEFYQVNNQQRDRASGLGLGLAIAKRALTLLGGEVTCRSQLGRGSLFEFRLPLARPAPGVAQASGNRAVEEVANESFAQGKRFVVVEDDTLVAQATSNWLEGMGAEVKCFHNAEDALRHIGVDHADCYIADYMLGGTLNGIQFLNTLRQKLDKPIKAVLVTGDTSTAFMRHAASCDWPILHKPINTSRLISELCRQTQ